MARKKKNSSSERRSDKRLDRWVKRSNLANNIIKVIGFVIFIIYITYKWRSGVPIWELLEPLLERLIS